MKKLLLICCASCFLLNVNSQQVLDQSNIGVNPTRSLVDNMQNCLQSFVPQISGTLVEVKVDIETEDCPYPLICKIFEGEVGANVLATEIINITTNSPRSMQSITFSTPPELVADMPYTIALYANCVSGPGYSIWWYKSVNDAYDAGQAYNQWGANTQPEDTLNDFYFQTYMEALWGLDEQNDVEIEVSPMPVNDEAKVTIGNNLSTEIQLINPYGAVIVEYAFTAETILSTSTLSDGLYFIRVTQNGISTSKRLLVSH